MKKIIMCATLLILLLPFAYEANVFASEKQFVKIDQISANMPEMQIFFHVLDQQKSTISTPVEIEDISVQCDGQALHLAEIAAVSDQPKEMYLLLDVSDSMPTDLFEEIKRQITSLYKNAADTDKLILLTFGAEAKVVLDGSEGCEKASQTIAGLRNDANTTVLFDAIEKAVEMANTQTTCCRKAMFVFTDGEDWVKGGNTAEEVADLVSQGGIPLYAFGAAASQKANIDKLGELARSSGGKIEIISASDTAKKLSTLVEYVNSGFVAMASADSNANGGESSRVALQIGSAADSRMLRIQNWKTDLIRPQIANVTADGAKAIVTFSEPVRNADSNAAYQVSKGKRSIPVVRVTVLSSRETELSFARPLYNGTYTIMTEGVTDAAVEKNPLSDSYELTIEGYPYTAGAFFAGNWLYVVLGTVVLVTAVVAYLLLHRRAEAVRAGQAATRGDRGTRNEKIQIEAENGIEAMLTISSRNLVRRVVTVNIEGSILIGRSKSCDICIEDAQISRQNTALNCHDHRLYVQNLSETNGTMLNGMAIRDMREVKSGDTIFIGDARIVVTYK